MIEMIGKAAVRLVHRRYLISIQYAKILYMYLGRHFSGQVNGSQNTNNKEMFLFIHPKNKMNTPTHRLCLKFMNNSVYF